ncbi:histone-lysine N-methyltransferase trithorax-like, partial [Cotesia glomerata]|uniref:histone-lysine N-methyltransferase trithorax-like n=1 Tax=Cotesia glomerata TaxID=32391 RepID=UPI001D007626
MGRSKFPGKPPKTVTRKRIKVLGRPETTQSDSVTVAENIYYGLSLFNETFGDNEKEHRPFHGFSNKEVKLSTSCVKTSKKNPENDKLNQQNDEKKINESLTENLLLKTLETENNYNQQKIKDRNNSNLPESTSNNIIVVKETVNVNKKSSEDGKKLKSGNKSKVGKGVVKFKRVVRTPILKAVNNILDRHQRTRQLRNSTAKRLLQRAKYNITSNNRNITIQSSDKSNAIKKFVLPMRSAHSSRVIKPNKRFIEESEQSSSADNEDAKQSKKSKTAGKSHGRAVKSKIKQYKNNSTASINTSKSVKNYKFKGTEDKRSRKHSGDVKKSTSLLSKTKMTSKINNNVKSSPTTIIGKLSESSTSESIPSKVLPDSNTPNFESSRVKTRLRIPSENPIDTENLSLINNVNSIRSYKKIDIINSVILSSSCSDDNDECTQETDKNCDIESQNRLDTFESDSSLSESTSESNHNSEDEQSEWTGMKLDGGKVILRKARLKLENKNSGGTEGPFSVTSIQQQQQQHQHIHNNSNNNHNTSINSSLTGTVKCGVCGAVRFYRFVNQARKFGIYSCESCRKFISKIIKHQACAKSTNTTLPVLQCHKGDGMCLVPPVVRSQQWNLMRCAYKARCPACWLKMCLKCYNIPTSIKTGLNSLLPPLHRDPVMSLGSMSQDSDGLDNQKTVGSKINWPAEDSLEKNLFKSAISWTGIQERKVGYQSGQGLLVNKFNKVDYPISMSLSKKRKKDTRIKIRKKIKSPLVLSPPSACSSPTASQSTQSTQPLRQRVDLKGPRVKHVCRSASVALGQPVATFPSTDEKDESDVSNKNATVKTKDEDKRPDTREKVSKSNQENNANSTNNNTVQTSYAKKSKVQSNNLVSSHHNLRALAKSGKNKIHEISIDFWEQYDPTEVGAKGFALIASETFPIPAICFLCGSAGKEPLIHCQCCCEPYHAFCLEPSEWNACVQPDWCCPRCTICQTCSQRTGPKLSCIRCRQSFHHSCLSKSGVNTRLYSPDRPYICQNCVKCKSCGSEGVNVYVGNLPLCSMCFKLRQRGNYCPLCQRCYNENDFNTKMMECNECSCWVHAHCEGLSDEFYQVLSYLPDSIEFTCSQCSPNPNSTSWRNAIDKELKTGFVAVLKSLSKNRKVCNALNWSPRKECLCKPVVSVRKLLDFSNIDNNSSKLNSNKELTINDNKETDYNNYDKFYSNGDNNKIDPLSQFDFEADEQQQQQEVPRRGLRKLKQKFHLKECSVRVKNCIVKDGNDSSSNGETNNQSLNSNDNSNSARECLCLEENILMKPSPSLMSVKRKVNNNEYQSLFQFHCDMEHVVNRAGKQDLTLLYHRSLQEIFPWFDPNQAKVNSYDEELSSSSADIDGERDSSISKLNDSILETWKEEVVKASKAITMRTGNVYSELLSEDTRVCALCKGIGDGQENREGRLLYCGQNEWVHANCALWSNEVFEEIDGSLQNVHSAISRGRMIRCGECGKKGASVGCCAKNCGNTFHYPCARNAGLGLNDDKTIYCTLHLANCINKNQNEEENFSLKRLVYVEFGRKKKKFVEPDRVKVMIGSLMIDCLGTVMPEFSDSNEKIIPTNYKCSRLYWSTINPMKIVRYYIRTYVKTCTTDINLDMDHNVTIDHSKEQETEERLKIENLAIKQTLDSLIDSVYNREVDDNLAEQNNTDLLPPEITDVIFQDLPHDLLDGISMQDIFPKMSYEDFLAMDLRNDGVFGNDILKDEILSSDVDDEMIKSPLDGNKLAKDSSTLSEIAEQNDIWLHLETKSSVQEFMDDLLNSKSQKFGGKELKRSKSEVIGSNPLVVGGQRRHHQRSCSLTWSCKLDGTYGPTVKRRKLSRPSTAITGEVNSYVVDSAEKNSMFHELRIPESIMVTVGRAPSPTINESVREFKYCIDDQGINRRIMPTREDKDHKRLLWHTRQQPRMLQVDGPADPSSASECSSPEYDVEEKLNSDGYKIIVNERDNFSDIDSEESLKIPQLDGADDISSDDESHSNQMDTIIYVPHTIEDGPVTCKRCQCTYRTHDSYNRHLSNCDIVTTSDSDSETIDHKSASSSTFFDDSHSPQFVTLSSPSQGRTLSTDYPDIQVTSPLEASVPSPHTGLQIEPIAQALITPQIHSHETVETLHQTVLTSNEVIVQTQYTRTTTTLPNSSAAVLPQESSIKIIEITDSPAHEQTSQSLVLSNDNQNQHQSVVSPYVPSVIQPDSSVMRDIDETLINHQQQATVICNNKVLKPKPRVVKAKTKVIKPQYIKNNLTQQHLEPIRFQTIHQNSSPMVHLQQAPRANAPTVILQQVPSSGIMSAYVDTLQQQSDQNLQYITTIGGQETAYKPQFISTNQLVPGAYIHTASDNLLALSNGGISVLPSVQIAQPQPAVLGTIIQQQPNAIQCGVISSEQLVLSSTPTLEMFTDSTGSMFVSSQPMYYGLETIVSNTVMSSSQFVTGAVPQVLASSYQTTTQVFQASKLMEPIVDVQTMPSVSTVQAVQGIPSVPLQTQNQTVPTVQSIQSIPAVQTVQNVPNIGSYVVMNSQPVETPIASTASLNHPGGNIGSTTPGDQNFEGLSGSIITTEPMTAKLQIQEPEVANPVAPYIDMSSRSMSTATAAVARPIQNHQSIPRIAVRPSPVSQQTVTQPNYGQWKFISEPIYSVEQQTVSSSTRPYLDSKHVSENTSMIKSSLSSKVSPLSNHCVTQRDIVKKLNNCDVVGNNGHDIYHGLSSNFVSSITLQQAGLNNINNSNSSNVSNLSNNSNNQNKIMTSLAPTRPMNRVLPMLAVVPKLEAIKPDINDIEEPTKEIKPIIESESIETLEKSTIELSDSVNKNFTDKFFNDKPLIVGDNLISDEILFSDDKLFVDKKNQVIVDDKVIEDKLNEDKNAIEDLKLPEENNK